MVKIIVILTVYIVGVATGLYAASQINNLNKLDSKYGTTNRKGKG